LAVVDLVVVWRLNSSLRKFFFMTGDGDCDCCGTTRTLRSASYQRP
jgi:hypothetical protein